MYQYSVKAVKVIDGDTLDMIVDLGFHVTITLRIRLRGINAPERFTPAGKGAIAFVNDWLATHPLESLILETTKDKTEKYGRYLGVVRSKLGGNLNADMVAAQHAVPYMTN